LRPLALAALATASLLATPAGGRAAAPDAVEAAAPLPRLLVLDLAVQGSAPKELGRALGDVAAAEASRVGGSAVLSQGDVAAQLGVEKSRQMLGCAEDESCMLEIAGALSAERLLAGSVTLVEGTYLLSMKLVDARKARSLARAADTLKAPTQAELADGVRRLAHEVLTGRKLDTTGVVRIEVDEAGAAVALDGRSLGLSPIEGGQRVLEGTHRITIQKSGFVPWESSVQVAAGVTVPVKGTLVPVAAIEGEKKVFVELYAGFTPAAGFEVGNMGACTTNCVGSQAGVRGGFMVTERLAVEAFFVPYHVVPRTERRSTTVSVPNYDLGGPPWTYQAATSPDYERTATFGATYAGVSASWRFLDRTPITLRLMAGVARGYVFAAAGGYFPDAPVAGTGHYNHPDVETQFWSWIAGPELRAGYRFSRGFAVDVGIAAMALRLPSSRAETGGAMQDQLVLLPPGPAFEGGVAWFFPVTAGVRWDL
jgi:hypothetical protein